MLLQEIPCCTFQLSPLRLLGSTYVAVSCVSSHATRCAEDLLWPQPLRPSSNGRRNMENCQQIPQKASVSIWLREIIPKDALQFLRYLEIVFPPFGEEEPCTYCPPHSTEWHDWIDTLEYVKDRLDLPKLTLRAYFAEWLPTNGQHRIPPYRERMNEGQSQAVQRCYLEIIRPLARLGGLRRFFAYLPDPRGPWAKEDDPYHDEGWPLSLEALEGKAERMVIGDEYDSAAVGKADQAESRWIVCHDGHVQFT